MADNTPYHSFNRFDKLESWDYNPDFEKLDERLELRGPFADRPSSAPDGAKYVVDDPNDADHGAVYIYDSGTSTWNKQPVNAPAIDNEVRVTWEAGDDLGAKFNDAVATHGRDNVRYVVQPGEGTQPTISTPIDATDFRHAAIDFRGVVPVLATAGQVAIDLTDAWDLDFRFTQLELDTTDVPDAAMLIGNADSTAGTFGQGPELRTIVGGKVVGPSQVAHIVVHGRERNYIRAHPLQTNGQGYAYSIAPYNNTLIGGVETAVASPYKTLQVPSSASKTWIQGSAFSRSNVGDGCLFIGGDIPNSSFRDMEFRSVGEPHIVTYVDTGHSISLTFDNIRARMDTDVSSDAAAPFIDVRDPNSTGNYIRSWTLRDLDIELAEGTASSQPLIDGPSSTANAIDLTTTGYAQFSSVTGIEWPNGFLKGLDTREVDMASDVTFDADSTVRQATLNSVTVKSGVEVNGDQSFASSDSANTVIMGGSGGTIRNMELGHTGTADALRVNAQDCTAENIHVSSSGGDGMTARSSNGGTRFRNCLIEGASADALQLDEPDATCLSMTVLGNCHLTGNALRCVVSGYISGDVTFDSGSDNNDLTNCVIDGTVTNNGGTGNTW